jgi:hypothetical protein
MSENPCLEMTLEEVTAELEKMRPAEREMNQRKRHLKDAYAVRRAEQSLVEKKRNFIASLNPAEQAAIAGSASSPE